MTKPKAQPRNQNARERAVRQVSLAFNEKRGDKMFFFRSNSNKSLGKVQLSNSLDYTILPPNLDRAIDQPFDRAASLEVDRWLVSLAAEGVVQ